MCTLIEWRSCASKSSHTHQCSIKLPFAIHVSRSPSPRSKRPIPSADPRTPKSHDWPSPCVAWYSARIKIKRPKQHLGIAQLKNDVYKSPPLEVNCLTGILKPICPCDGKAPPIFCPFPTRFVGRMHLGVFPLSNLSEVCTREFPLCQNISAACTCILARLLLYPCASPTSTHPVHSIPQSLPRSDSLPSHQLPFTNTSLSEAQNTHLVPCFLILELLLQSLDQLLSIPQAILHFCTIKFRVPQLSLKG